MAIVLLVAATLVLVRVATDFVTGDEEFAVRTTGAVNGVLLVLIVIELMADRIRSTRRTA